MARRYPDTEILAVEPSAVLCDWQLKHGFPRPDRLLAGALSDRVGQAKITVPRLGERRSSMVRGVKGSEEQIQTTTLDALAAEYGITDAVLWLDIEGMEWQALQGAERLFAARGVILANIEVMLRDHPNDAMLIDMFMIRHGLRLALVWEMRHDLGIYDRLYILDGHPAVQLCKV